MMQAIKNWSQKGSEMSYTASIDKNLGPVIKHLKLAYYIISSFGGWPTMTLLISGHNAVTMLIAYSKSLRTSPLKQELVKQR